MIEAADLKRLLRANGIEVVPASVEEAQNLLRAVQEWARYVAREREARCWR